jgi:hypothetical protein
MGCFRCTSRVVKSKSIALFGRCLLATWRFGVRCMFLRSFDYQRILLDSCRARQSGHAVSSNRNSSAISVGEAAAGPLTSSTIALDTTLSNDDQIIDRTSHQALSFMCSSRRPWRLFSFAPRVSHPGVSSHVCNVFCKGHVVSRFAFDRPIAGCHVHVRATGRCVRARRRLMAHLHEWRALSGFHQRHRRQRFGALPS